MKKFLAIIFIMTFVNLSPVFAKNVKVTALSDFSTINPPKSWSVEVAESFTTKSGYEVPAGSIISGKITDVTNPKRLKRNAGFKFIPTSFYDSKTNETYKVNKDYVGKYNFLGDIKTSEVIEKGAIAAGNHFISCTIGPGIALAEGVVKNEQGNRAKSAVVSVYESTPLSYVSKGKELEFKRGQVFTMNFKMLDEEDYEGDVN